MNFFLFPPDQVRESSIASIFRIIQAIFTDRDKTSPEFIIEKKAALCKPSCLKLCQNISYRNQSCFLGGWRLIYHGIQFSISQACLVNKAVLMGHGKSHQPLENEYHKASL